MAAKFWVGGGTNTNWNSSPTTNWANSSGGTGNQTAPTTGDDVTFDNASGTGASVWNTTISLNSLNCATSRNVVSLGANTITISGGNLTLPGGVGGSFTPAGNTSLFTFTGTAGTQTLTSNGANLGALTINGAGGTVQLQDNLNVSFTTGSFASIITLTAGTFDCQTFTVTTANFSSSGAGVRALKGSGAWTINGTGNVAQNLWVTTTTTNFTVTLFTSAITFSATTTARGVITMGNLSLGAITFAANTSKGCYSITNAAGATFSSLTINFPNRIAFSQGQTLTITNAFTWTGSTTNFSEIGSTQPGTQATISVASGNPTMSGYVLSDMAFTGGATFTATNSYDLGNNTGITITAPSAGGISRSRIQTGM